MSKIVFTEDATSLRNKIIYEKIGNPEDRFRFLCQAITEHDVRRLKDLAYETYLHSLYWNIVREYIVNRSGKKCTTCESKKMLNVHHRNSNYEFRGEEFRNLDCLIVLCQTCHLLGHVFEKAKIDVKKVEDKLKEFIEAHTVVPIEEFKVNKNYDPQTIMNLKTFGDIRGYQYDK